MSKQPPARQAFPDLLVPRNEARKSLSSQIERGHRICDRSIHSEAELDQARSDKTKWKDYNTELLARIFSGSSIAQESRGWDAVPFKYGNTSLSYRTGIFHQGMRAYLTKLESLRDRLELIPESRSAVSERSSPGALSAEVFIVHGHDEPGKQSVARFIQRLGLRAIILHEQPNAGRTIIEKFEDHAEVAYAVVLLTPDDTGFSSDAPAERRRRARQNVVFEFGLFMGKLGRKRVCALHKGDLELPSDLDGVLYIPFDGEGWKVNLARELKAAGLNVDLDKAL